MKSFRRALMGAALLWVASAYAQVPQFQRPDLSIPSIKLPAAVAAPAARAAEPRAAQAAPALAQARVEAYEVVPSNGTARQILNATEHNLRINPEMRPNEPEIQRYKRCADEELQALTLNSVQLSFEGLTGFLTYDGTPLAATTNAEDLREESRAHAGRFLECLAKLDALGAGPRAAQERLDARIRRLQARNFPQYDVHRSDGTNHTPIYSPPPERVVVQVPPDTEMNPKRPSCHDEDYITTAKVPVQVGFDDRGNPRYEMRWDVVHRTRQVCD